MALRHADVRRGSPEPVPDDRYLVLAFQEGDPGSYRVIHERYRGAVERLCRRVLGNFHDAEEASQETFLRVYRALPRFNGRYELRAWIARIATNVCLDMIRATASTRRSVNDTDISEVANVPGNGAHQDPFEAYERDARSKSVRRVLEQLPEHYRAALILREFEGLSHEEMGAILQLSAPQVKALVHRAKRAFRRVWFGEQAGVLSFLPPALVYAILALRRWAGDVRGAAVTQGAEIAPSVPMATAAASAGERMIAVVAAVVVTGAATLGPAAMPHSRQRADAARAARSSHSILAEAALAPPAGPVGKAAIVRPADPSVAPHGIATMRGDLAAPPQKESPEAAPSPGEEPQAGTEPEGSAPAGGNEPAGGDPSAEPAPGSEPATPAPSAAPSAPPQAPDEDTSAAAPSPPAAAPSPTPSANPQPPTGFSFSFGWNRTTDQRCNCGAHPSVADQSVSADSDGMRSFSGRVDDAVIDDALGRPSWPVQVTQSGSSSRVSLRIVIYTIRGWSELSATGSFVSRRVTSWGGWEYTFSGSYHWVDPPKDPGMPSYGSFRVTLSFSWERLVSETLSLREGA